MARLRINQGLDLTLDATSTDFQVKSLAGSNNANLLINGRNFGVEVRIDEGNTGKDFFRVTQGPKGANTLFSVDSGGALVKGLLEVGGFDLKLGTADQTSRGDTGASRALVKAPQATLVINYAGDFSGGVRVDGPGMNIVGKLGVGTTSPFSEVYNSNTSYQIAGANSNATVLHIFSPNNAPVLNLQTNKDTDGATMGGIVWTRQSGQLDVHRQIAGIEVVQSGTGAIAGSAIRFWTKASSYPNVRMVIDKNGNVGIGVTAPTERVETDGNVKAVRFISTAATGVPPLQVSSTTKVDNLNADLLDGYDSTDFPRKAENAVISGIWNFSTIGINKANPEHRLVVEEASKPIAAVIRKTNNGSGGGLLDGPTLLVENNYGNHSWGNLAEFRIGNNGGTEPPHITFTAGWASTGWAVGMAGKNDADFGIASDRGWRFGNFGTVQLRVKSDGQLIARGTITPGVSSGFAGHINGSEPIKFSNGSDAQEIYVRKVRASASWATNDANDPGDGGGFFSGNLLVGGQIRFSDKRTINVYVDHGGDPNTRYYYLGRVHINAGILKVQGIMGGHTWDQGRANVDVQFSARDGFRIDGEVIGKLGSADIWVYAPSGDSYIYLYLVTNTWALVNLELSAVGVVNIGFDGTFSYSAPVYNNNSLPSYKLSTDAQNVLRYTSERDAGWIPVSYSLGGGVYVRGSFNLVAKAFAMGPFALITIYPGAWSGSSGFAGEGTITLSMPLTRLRNALALDSAKTLGIISVMLTTHVTNTSIFNDNEYHYHSSYHDSASDSWGIQVYRSRFAGSDSPNLLHAWILTHFY